MGLQTRPIVFPLCDYEGFGEVFAELVNHALANRLPEQEPSMSTLELIPKLNGGSRPIGMGTILRRLAAKLVAKAEGGNLREFCEAENQYALSG